MSMEPTALFCLPEESMRYRVSCAGSTIGFRFLSLAQEGMEVAKKKGASCRVGEMKECCRGRGCPVGMSGAEQHAVEVLQAFLPALEGQGLARSDRPAFQQQLIDVKPQSVKLSLFGHGDGLMVAREA